MADHKTTASKNDLDDSLWDSPVKPAQNNAKDARPNGPPRQSHEDDQARDTALRQELSSVRRVNEALEGVLDNLERAKTNMKTVNQTVGAASALLDTWTRILSQTEHNQRLILDPNWQGAGQDMADAEAEAQAKEQAASRREAEEQERKAAAMRKADEDDRKRTIENTNPPRSSARGRGRASARGASTGTRPASSGYGTATTDNSMSSIGRGSYSSRRPASGIGRGTRGSTRGRG